MAAGAVNEAANPSSHGEWDLRPWVLAGLLGLAGFLVWLAMPQALNSSEPWRAALAALAFFAPLALAFTLDRSDWRGPLVFAALVGAVMAGIAWRVASADPYLDIGGFWFAGGVVSCALALPLFQAGWHRLRGETPYPALHYHVWTDAISAGGALAFTGLAWLVILLLSELFHAIRIDLLRDLMGEDWFGWVFSGLAFGAALGVLRNQLKVIGTLQNVVLLVLALIAVPLAVALTIFLLAVATSGLDVLWSATNSATPLLLALAAGSFVLVNAVLRDRDEAASASRAMRYAALVLALGILPLAILAAISLGTRIHQHGLSPERIWGLVAIIVAVAFGIAYFVAAIRRRRSGWDILRRANIHLAVGTSVLALLLALPILDFGAIATRNQIARLAAGKVAPDTFDYAALRWDFGEAGRRALARLASSPDEAIAAPAAEALAQKTAASRYGPESIAPSVRMENLRVVSEDPLWEGRIRQWVRTQEWHCTGLCIAIDTGIARGDGRWVRLIEGQSVADWIVPARSTPKPAEDGIVTVPAAPRTSPQVPELRPNSKVEIREWTGRRIYIDGQPVGEPFDTPANALEGGGPPR